MLWAQPHAKSGSLVAFRGLSQGLGLLGLRAFMVVRV